MKGKIILFTLISTLILMNVPFFQTLKADNKEIDIQLDDDLSYKLILPSNYKEESEQSYPVLYLMPEDGQSSYSDKMISMIKEEMATNNAGDMILVLPHFNNNQDFRKGLDTIIEDVDNTYNTIAKVDQRAILGVGLGGYMAYVYSMTDEDSIMNEPDSIKNIGSIRGDFNSSDHPFQQKYGNVYDIINEIGSENIYNYYTYLDSPTEDESTYKSESTNDIGSLFIDWFQMAPYQYHEYTARFGSYNETYLKESIHRVINRFSKQFYGDLVSGSISLSPQVAASSVENIDVGYDLEIHDYFNDLSVDTLDMDIEVTLIDPDNQEIFYTSADTVEVTDPERLEGAFSIPNMVNGKSSNVQVTANILGFEMEIGKEALVRIQDTGSAPDEQLIDLMGDWKFNAYKEYSNSSNVSLDNIDNVTKDVWSSWGTVQPGLDWWPADFDESLGENPNWTGYAWYVREFDIPTDFANEDLVLALGKFDEADEVYINGSRIGSTGIPEPGGNYDNSNPWDVDRVYDLDSTVLNYGGTNTIAVRMVNSNGAGGWYEGPIGIYSPAAYNKVIGLPSELADSSTTERINSFVDQQNKALETKDLTTYAATIAPNYFQAGYDKNRLLEKVKEYLAGDGEVSISDQSRNVYLYQDMYLYKADRTITTANGETITEPVNQYYLIEDDKISLYGDHERFYLDQYSSEYAASAKEVDGPIDMNYRIYLPDGYFTSDKRYPVVYLLHQFSSTSKSYEIDGIDKLLEAGMSSGDIQDMIVVIPDSDGLSWWRGDWERMVTEDLVPFVNVNYRTIADARYNGTAGASMGGQGAYGIGLRNPNYFSSIISFFGAFSYGGENSPNAIASEVSAEYLQNFSHYFISGNRDVYGFGTPNIRLDQQLRASGVDHKFFIENGEHNSAFYTPFVIDAFSYVSDSMYTTNGTITDHFTGEIEATMTKDILAISTNLEFLDSFDQWLNVIPDSKYTLNTNPDMEIPITYQIEQDGKIVFNHVEYTEISGSTNIELDQEIHITNALSDSDKISALDVDEEKGYTLTVFASILDSNKELGKFEYTVNDTEPDKEKEDEEQEEKPIEDQDNPTTPPNGNKDDDKQKEKGQSSNNDGEMQEESDSTATESNQKLPNTATNNFNVILAGILLLILGLAITILIKRRKLLK
ncbi:alpha/beta hydrolase-fold protein [Gracilibacillus massiliensis]|uniref:alpha/beta hydrolase-fold protein n=1 Tax=Gracilibacillus massiliensis TaxID=1564956 RepID=UPI00071C4CDE|nr:alpha/beta hydrolase-fold protein [Gracilibacillus massiliensis]